MSIVKMLQYMHHRLSNKCTFNKIITLVYFVDEHVFIVMIISSISPNN